MTDKDADVVQGDEESFYFLNKVLADNGFAGVDGDDFVILEIVDPKEEAREHNYVFLSDEFGSMKWSPKAICTLIDKYRFLRRRHWPAKVPWVALSNALRKIGYDNYTTDQCRRKICSLIRKFKKILTFPHIFKKQKWRYFQLLMNIHRDHPLIHVAQQNKRGEAVIRNSIIKNQTLVIPMPGAFTIWSKSATKLLLMEYAKLNKGVISNEKCKVLSATMIRHGYNYSPIDCKNKMKMLMGRYLKLKRITAIGEKMAQDYGYDVTWDLFKIMEQIFGNQRRFMKMEPIECHNVEETDGNEWNLETLDDEFANSPPMTIIKHEPDGSEDSDHSTSTSESDSDKDTVLRWPHRATVLLIKEYERLKYTEFDENIKYMLLEAHLKTHGFTNFTYKNCRSKLRHLISKYEVIKLRQEEPGCKPSEWCYFKLMDKCEGETNKKSKANVGVTKNISETEVVQNNILFDFVDVMDNQDYTPETTNKEQKEKDDLAKQLTPENEIDEMNDALLSDNWGPVRWKPRVTSTLIDKYRFLRKRNWPGKVPWGSLSSALHKNGYKQFSEIQCRRKMSRLLRKFKKMLITPHLFKKNQKWPYFKHLMNIHKDHPLIDAPQQTKQGAVIQTSMDTKQKLPRLAPKPENYNDNNENTMHWTPQATILLIEEFDRLQRTEFDENIKYILLDIHLKTNGFVNFTPKNCRGRIRSLITKYEKVKSIQEETGGKPEWCYFKLMDKCQSQTGVKSKAITNIARKSKNIKTEIMEDDNVLFDFVDVMDDKNYTPETTKKQQKTKDLSSETIWPERATALLLKEYSNLSANTNEKDKWIKLSYILTKSGFEFTPINCKDHFWSLTHRYLSIKEGIKIEPSEEWPLFKLMKPTMENYLKNKKKNDIIDGILYSEETSNLQKNFHEKMGIKKEDESASPKGCGQHCTFWDLRMARRVKRHRDKMGLLKNLISTLKNYLESLSKPKFKIRCPQLPETAIPLLIHNFSLIAEEKMHEMQRWRKLQSMMYYLGYDMNSNQCRSKVSFLLKKYFDLRLATQMDPSAEVHWAHYNLMDNYFRNSKSYFQEVGIIELDKNKSTLLQGPSNQESDIMNVDDDIASGSGDTSQRGWSSFAVYALLEKYRTLTGEAVPDSEQWQTISRQLTKMGYSFTEEQCCKKLISLLTTYADLMKGQTDWMYYNEIHSIFKKTDIRDTIRKLKLHNLLTSQVEKFDNFENINDNSADVPMEIETLDDIETGEPDEAPEPQEPEECKKHCNNWEDRMKFRQEKHEDKMRLRNELLIVLKDLSAWKVLYTCNSTKKWPTSLMTTVIEQFAALCRTTCDGTAIYESLVDTMQEHGFKATPDEVRLKMQALLSMHQQPHRRGYTEWTYGKLLDKYVGDMEGFLYKENILKLKNKENPLQN